MLGGLVIDASKVGVLQQVVIVLALLARGMSVATLAATLIILAVPAVAAILRAAAGPTPIRVFVFVASAIASLILPGLLAEQKILLVVESLHIGHLMILSEGDEAIAGGGKESARLVCTVVGEE